MRQQGRKHLNCWPLLSQLHQQGLDQKWSVQDWSQHPGVCWQQLTLLYLNASHPSCNLTVVPEALD